MDVKFDFEFAGTNIFGKIYRPMAKVSFRSFRQDSWTDVWMVVDTGADFSILPKYFAETLDISLENDCIIDSTRGVGGEQIIYLLKPRLEAKIGVLARKVPLAFFSSDEVPPLLGRLGFLETFNAKFLKSHRVIFGN